MRKNSYIWARFARNVAKWDFSNYFLYTLLFIDTDENIVFFWLTGSIPLKTILAFYEIFFKTILFTVVYHDNLWRLS